MGGTRPCTFSYFSARDSCVRKGYCTVNVLFHTDPTERQERGGESRNIFSSKIWQIFLLKKIVCFRVRDNWKDLRLNSSHEEQELFSLFQNSETTVSPSALCVASVAPYEYWGSLRVAKYSAYVLYRMRPRPGIKYVGREKGGKTGNWDKWNPFLQRARGGGESPSPHSHSPFPTFFLFFFSLLFFAHLLSFASSFFSRQKRRRKKGLFLASFVFDQQGYKRASLLSPFYMRRSRQI